MKKIFILLGSMFLLVGCVESVALMGTGAANGKVVQASINTGVSYGIKAQTGKTPMQHAVNYTKLKKTNKKQKSCLSLANKKQLDTCLKLEKRIATSQKEIKKNKSSYKPPIEFTKALQSSINKKFQIKYLD